MNCVKKKRTLINVWLYHNIGHMFSVMQRSKLYIYTTLSHLKKILSDQAYLMRSTIYIILVCIAYINILPFSWTFLTWMSLSIVTSSLNDFLTLEWTELGSPLSFLSFLLFLIGTSSSYNSAIDCFFFSILSFLNSIFSLSVSMNFLLSTNTASKSRKVIVEILTINHRFKIKVNCYI